MITNGKDLLITYETTKNLSVGVTNFDIYVS